MARLALALALTLAAPSLADARCETQCAEASRKCDETCKKALKKDKSGADRVTACQDRCKTFEAECRSDCQAEKKPGAPAP